MMCLLFSLAAPASDKPAKGKEAPGQVVDSGSFGVFMEGRRVATETFSIHQDASGSEVKSEFQSESGTDKAAQSSELQLSASGELKSYEWTESSPGQSHAIVTPNQEFLIERYSKNPGDKPLEQPFLLPASTTMLDDYFFIQREVLAWKFLATTCKQDKGQVSCPLNQSAQLGTLNAHARASAPVSLQFAGRDKVSLHGVDHELIRLEMKSETGDSTLWLDDQLKLQRILDPTASTEVVRD